MRLGPLPCGVSRSRSTSSLRVRWAVRREIPASTRSAVRTPPLLSASFKAREATSSMPSFLGALFVGRIAHRLDCGNGWYECSENHGLPPTRGRGPCRDENSLNSSRVPLPSSSARPMCTKNEAMRGFFGRGLKVSGSKGPSKEARLAFSVRMPSLSMMTFAGKGLVNSR